LFHIARKKRSKNIDRPRSQERRGLVAKAPKKRTDRFKVDPVSPMKEEMARPGVFFP